MLASFCMGTNQNTSDNTGKFMHKTPYSIIKECVVGIMRLETQGESENRKERRRVAR